MDSFCFHRATALTNNILLTKLDSFIRIPGTHKLGFRKAHAKFLIK